MNHESLNVSFGAPNQNALAAVDLSVPSLLLDALPTRAVQDVDVVFASMALFWGVVIAIAIWRQNGTRDEDREVLRGRMQKFHAGRSHRRNR